MEEDFSKLTVPQLKAKLKERGLPVSGSKAELVERLTSGGSGMKRKAAQPKESKKAKKQKTEDEEGGEDDGTATTSAELTDFSVPAIDEGEIKVISWNVASWKTVQGVWAGYAVFSQLPQKGLPQYLKDENPDIICFNETKIDESLVSEDKIPGYHAYFHSCSYNVGYAGTGVLTKQKPISVIRGIGIQEHDTEGRCITLEYEKYYLVATYIPNAGEKDPDTKYPKKHFIIGDQLSLTAFSISKRMKWDLDFQNYLKYLDKKKPVVWCGDLNVAHKDIDLKNPKTNTKTAGFTKEERESFGKFLEAGFVDTYRHYYPKEIDCYTFWAYRGSARQKGIGWRLDYFICSERFVPNVTKVFIRKHVMGSDHCPIGCIIKL